MKLTRKPDPSKKFDQVLGSLLDSNAKSTDARLSQVLKQASEELVMMMINVIIDLVDIVQPAPPNSLSMIGHFPNERKKREGIDRRSALSCLLDGVSCLIGQLLAAGATAKKGKETNHET